MSLIAQLSSKQNYWHTVGHGPVFDTLGTPGSVTNLCRNISLKQGGSKLKTVPPRYLGQPSPFTHPHLLKHGKYGFQGHVRLEPLFYCKNLQIVVILVPYKITA